MVHCMWVQDAAGREYSWLPYPTATAAAVAAAQGPGMRACLARRSKTRVKERSKKKGWPEIEETFFLMLMNILKSSTCHRKS